MDDEKDINAVLSGVSAPSPLRGVLARLDTNQQALILGHAVPMPVVIPHARLWHARVQRRVQLRHRGGAATQGERSVDDLFPE